MAENGSPSAAAARILIVDDTEANRDILVRRLQRQGHQTATAVNGREALEMLGREAFDIILLDIMMPEMNGFEVLERIKADDTLKYLPVILISALDDNENMARGIAMGADDFLPKPFNKYILKARIDAGLAKKRLHDREQVYTRALEREMDIARNIQSEFLPDHLPTLDGLELAVWFEPARHVAGDFYDTIELDGEGGKRLALVVADVCDKGVAAALFMAVCRSLLRALAERILSMDGDPAIRVPQLIAAVNDYSARTHGHANMFTTLFFGILDTDTGRLVYVNGGHEPPIITGTHGVRTELAPTGPAVGMLPDRDFGAKLETIGIGETLILYTDGVTDSHDGSGALFSRERLLEVAAQPARSAQVMADRIHGAVQAHARGAPSFDDITLLVVRRRA